MEVRTATITYSKTQARLKRQYESELNTEISDLNEIINVAPTPEIISRYNFLQSELEKKYDYRSKGSILRSKINNVEYGEKNSKFFLNLEKNNYETKHIKKMITENNVTITTKKGALQFNLLGNARKPQL